MWLCYIKVYYSSKKEQFKNCLSDEGCQYKDAVRFRQKIEDGKKMFSSHFDRNRAKELGMSEEEIRLHETGVKNREHFIYSN